MRSIENTEIPCPTNVVASEELEEKGADLLRTRRYKSQQQNSGLVAPWATHREVAKVSIKRDNQSSVSGPMLQQR